MVSKDQAIGGLICAVCVIVAIFYVSLLFYPSWLGVFGVAVTWVSDVQFWVIAIPVFIAFIAIMAIGAWIGWTMATTPPPKPIEEITSEIEEKKEETTAPLKEEAKPAQEPEPEPVPSEEEKKPERRRRP